MGAAEAIYLAENSSSSRGRGSSSNHCLLQWLLRLPLLLTLPLWAAALAAAGAVLLHTGGATCLQQHPTPSPLLLSSLLPHPPLHPLHPKEVLEVEKVQPPAQQQL